MRGAAHRHGAGVGQNGASLSRCQRRVNAGSGRPLRAFAVAIGLTTAWFAVRVPGLEGRYDAALLAVRPPTLAAVRAAVVAELHRRLSPAGAATRVAQGRRPPSQAQQEPVLPRSGAGTTLPTGLRTSASLAAPAGDTAALGPPGVIPPLVVKPMPERISPPLSPGFDLATQAYARLAAGIGGRRTVVRGGGCGAAGGGVGARAAAVEPAMVGKRLCVVS